LQNWTEQIFKIDPGDIIAKLGSKDILNCDNFFLQTWGGEILEIPLGDFIAILNLADI